MNLSTGKNYKVGWLLPEKIAALTHFHAKITQADIRGVVQETRELLATVKNPFHIIIDTRLAPISKLYTLAELQASAPFLKHPLLKYIVLVKPDHLVLQEQQLEVETCNNVQLKNVYSIPAAIDFLRRQNDELDITKLINTFFP